MHQQMCIIPRLGRLARVGLLGRGVRRTQLLNAELSEPLAHVNRSLELLALDDTSEETTSEGVAGAVGVVDLALVDGVDGELLEGDLAAGLGDGDDGGVGALSDDDGALARRVLLGQLGHGRRDGGNVLRLEVVRRRPRPRLRLVANHVVPVRRRAVELLLEELGNEGGGEGEGEDLSRSVAAFGCDILLERTLFLAAASSASARMAGTQTVKW